MKMTEFLVVKYHVLLHSFNQGLAKPGNIVSCYVSEVAKSAGSKQNVLVQR